MRRMQQGFVLSEWLLAGVLGLLVLSAVVAGLQVQLRLQLMHQADVAQRSAVHWLRHRLAARAQLAGWGEVHPLLLDLPAGAQLDDQQLVLAWRSDQAQLDCEGRRHAAGLWLAERYFLRQDGVGEDWLLACDAAVCTDDGCHQLGDAGVPVQGGFARWEVHYGQQAEPAAPPVYRLRRALVAGQAIVSVRLTFWLTGSERVWQQTLAVPNG